jgi:DNA repair exonuclease SbcCD ATPase subunit
MTFKIKSITLKNFMSIGNVSQAVVFDQYALTLILGENLDLGGDEAGSRNGVGKTSMLNALSYAFYGQALTNIKKENLINKINGKNMLVTVDFEKDNVKYRIERGRKPNILKLFVNDKEQESKDDDESQGDSRETQKFIDQTIGISHTMFKHFVALNTYTEPFLSMKASDQREVIEQLLGITLLSEKAESLKVLVKESKDAILTEQIKIDSIKKSNENIQKSIDSLLLKSQQWEKQKVKDIEDIAISIEELEKLDIDAELQAHVILKSWINKNNQLTDLKRQKSSYESAFVQADKNLKKYQREIINLEEQKCPQCEQTLQSHNHEKLLKEAEHNLNDAKEYAEHIQKNLKDISDQIETLGTLENKPETFYKDEKDALSHSYQLSQLKKLIEERAETTNPYEEQIADLKSTALQPLDWTVINELSKLKEHQEFLLKLLTNKESFIRKKIIDQNLNYLNKRLAHYIETLGLPHIVLFQNDLSVEITHFGQDLDFDNLSRGERNRLILGMSFAFRDVWENLYQSINLLFIDELIDSGMDAAGVEAGLNVLKKLARERKKNIYLISHKDELVGKVNNVLRVVKESGFTTYSTDNEHVDLI